jgi:type II secretory pathway predicted ATPase ExeA
MYESFFQLTARPFPATPAADRYFPATSVEQARETITRCIERAEGPAVILGPAGTGKSTLCQVLAEQLRDRFQIATLNSARLCTRRALLQNILFELQLPYRDREEGELRLALIDYLQPDAQRPHGLLLIVDEAHMLPLRLLEEIRMLTNLVRNGEPRVRLVLAANLAFDERLASPRLESLNQRIAARCYLQSMNRDETCRYVCTLLRTAGGDPDHIFTPEALHAVHRASDGIPRLVNQVCDHVLMLAAVGHRSTVDAPGVEEAWADLQQLPTPWMRDDHVGESLPAAGSGILEFGALDEPPDGDCGTTHPPAEKPPVLGANLTEIDSGQIDDAAHDAAEGIAGCLEVIETSVSAEFATDKRPEHAAWPGSPGEDDQFHPALSGETEIELVFRQVRDPFDEQFEHEEVVVDSFAALETLESPCSNPWEIGPDRTRVEHVAQAEELVEMWAENRATVESLLSADPESLRATPGESASLIAENGPEQPGDDRDLIDVHKDQNPTVSTACGALVTDQPTRRREYRRLFATLRQRT